MSLAAVQSVSFKGCEGSNCQNKKTGGVVPLLASGFVAPGLGQYIDGRTPEAKKYFSNYLKVIGASAIGSAISVSSKFVKNPRLQIAFSVAGLGISTLAGINGFINYVKSARDAYKGDSQVDTQA